MSQLEKDFEPHVVPRLPVPFLQFCLDVFLDHAQQRARSFFVVLPKRVDDICAHARAVLHRLQRVELSGYIVEKFEGLFT